MIKEIGFYDEQAAGWDGWIWIDNGVWFFSFDNEFSGPYIDGELSIPG